jgi:hypothetical protein
VRALTSLRQFLDLGPWAVNLALTLGIFPYVMKLLQSSNYKQTLVGIWARILSFDSSCQYEVVKDGALPHFVQHLTWGLNRATMNCLLPCLRQLNKGLWLLYLVSHLLDTRKGKWRVYGKTYTVRVAPCYHLSKHPEFSSRPRSSYQNCTCSRRRGAAQISVVVMSSALGNLFKDNITTQAEGDLRLGCTCGSARGCRMTLLKWGGCRLLPLLISCLLSVPPAARCGPHLTCSRPLLQPMQQTTPSFNGTASSPAAVQGNQLLPATSIDPSTCDKWSERIFWPTTT